MKRTAFFISDGTGLTAEALGNSLLAQFEKIEFERVTVPYIDNHETAEAMVERINEAARVDGATPFRIAWRIQIPLITPALVLTTVFSIIGTLQLFAEPQVLSKVAPAIDSQFTPNLSAFTTAFAYNDYNVAAAQAVLIAVVAFVLSFVFLRLTNREDS